MPASSAARPPSPADSRPPAERLLAWYDKVKRPLPWRVDRDPYRIWVSEIMLQQTRVETAIPYYRRFLEAFPDLEALALAGEEEVLAHWSGLGYYRRARALWRAARIAFDEGGLPTTLEGWRRLPGIGAYTAAAIMSIAHGARVAALDGNLERVLSRLDEIETDPKTAAGRRLLDQAAQRWLDPERPGESNQALMELGAALCRPRSPLCLECPVSDCCGALAANRQEEFPMRRAKRAVVRRALIVVLVRKGRDFLLFRRSADSTILGGSWELPWIEADEKAPERSLAGRYGGGWSLGADLGAVRHSITHRVLSVSIRAGVHSAPASVAEGREARWTDLEGLDRLPHSSLVRKAVVKALGGP